MKKLAICIPTYNRAKLLDRLLKSIPPSPNIVVSVCDDGSSDNTLKVLNKHKSRFSIKYIYQKNEGRASALRKSILNVKAEFMLIMGSDDYFTKTGISTILNSIKNNKATVEDELAKCQRITIATMKAMCHLFDINVFLI